MEEREIGGPVLLSQLGPTNVEPIYVLESQTYDKYDVHLADLMLNEGGSAGGFSFSVSDLANVSSRLNPALAHLE